MSHFSTVQTKLSDRPCLIQALEDLKLPAQVYETPQPLKGYYGDSQGQSAELIVSGKSFQARADIGFQWNPESNVYSVIHDSYETDELLGENFFSHQLPQAYGKRVVLAKAAQLQQQWGECNITEQTNGDIQTVRLTFSGHQVQQYTRR